jgi:DNA-binding MarR family transcriptional regulator
MGIPKMVFMDTAKKRRFFLMISAVEFFSAPVRLLVVETKVASALKPECDCYDKEKFHADDHFALKLWLRILTCSNLIEARIRHHLRREFDCTLPRFDLLAQLDRADGLKMSELSQRLMVTGGNVTGLADQLQQEGWLVREAVENDRRATRLRLTEAGRDRFTGMARTHEGWVVEMLGALSRSAMRRASVALAARYWPKTCSLRDSALVLSIRTSS